MDIVPFQSSHIFALPLQAAQREFNDKFSPEYGRALEVAGNGWTALVDGKPVVCAGLVEQWYGRALAWALVGENAGPHFVRVVKAMRRALVVAHYTRVEAQVDVGFDQGVRLAEMLGFKAESVMRKFSPRGDAFMFVRIRE